MVVLEMKQSQKYILRQNKEVSMYKVWFDFVNDNGDVVTDFLDNNGQGFSFKVAEDLAHELKVRGHKNIVIELI